MNMNADQKLGSFFERRSIRAYKPGEVSQEVIQKLLQAAMAAPSGGGERSVALCGDPSTRRPFAQIAAALPNGKDAGARGPRHRRLRRPSETATTGNSATCCRIARRRFKPCCCARNILGLGRLLAGGASARKQRIKALTEESCRLRPRVCARGVRFGWYPAENLQPAHTIQRRATWHWDRW